MGSSGIYGIINGLAIVEALTSYAQSLSEKLKSHIINNSYAFLGIITLDLSNTFRLIGFLVTIIPFIHGAILTFSNKWYKHKITEKYRFDLAFLFFIVIFLHTSLFFFLALNITSFSFFVVLLWTIMLINTPWLAFQAFLTMKKLKRADVFLYGWIIINFNTFAFLSVFVVLPSSMFLNNENTSKDLIINGLILIVLVVRTIADYKIGWTELYNPINSRN